MVRKEVAILCSYIPQYRLEFYTQLYALSERNNIDLKVFYGCPSNIGKMKSDAVKFELGKQIDNKFYTIGNTELVWQPLLAEIRSADLVIAEQANRLLINYLLLLRQLVGVQKFAFAGHGRNHQAADQNKISELLKKKLARLPHWWFAYTDDVARLIEATGFPSDRITVFYNSIDTKALRTLCTEITALEIEELRDKTGVTSPNVCVYVGAMYSEKRIPFLLDACLEIRARVPDFQMVFIGAGADDDLVRKFCDDHRWAIYPGPLAGREKVKYLMMSKLLLMPGAVGLVVLDAFSMGVPIVTTDIHTHGPEISYIENGRNGVIVKPANDVAHYASVVTDLLLDEAKTGKLVAECEHASTLYTIEKMAERFADGIVRALSIK